MYKVGSLKDFYDNDDFDRMISYLKETKLETIGPTNVLSKTFSIFERKAHWGKLIDILTIIAKYKINVFDYEMKEGIRILISVKKLYEVLDIISLLLVNKKVIDEYVVTSEISACFSSKDQVLIEKCYNMIELYYELNKNISHCFWQTSIEGLVKNNQSQFAHKLLRLYPIKYSYSESLWKSVIVSNMQDNRVFDVFDMFLEKFEARSNSNDEFRAFENIFNIFVEEVTNHYEKLSSEKIENFYDIIIKKKVTIKENILEKFLAKVVEHNLTNFEKVESFITKSDCLLTQKIIERILEEYYKVNDNLSIFTILKMCKCKKIPVPYDTLTIPPKILKELLKFILDNTELNFEDSFYSALSEDNKFYVLRNFKCSCVKVINIGEEIEKNEDYIIKEEFKILDLEKENEVREEDDFVIY